mmetsp:Transcript_7022/g.9965  ORF Transcript_7022/g.9965 Transcript_7022/m.9965 type:complete len:200 (-) Transcript_7022:475-1074(-)
MLPGKGEWPVVGSFSSPMPAPCARSSGSSWLYSTLTVISSPLALCTSRAMAPMACFAARWMASELTSSESALLTPSMAGSVSSARALVSCRNTAQRKPRCSHEAAVPVLCISECTSPCPWGLASSRYLLSAASASLASLEIRAGTFPCRRSVIWSLRSPKLALLASNAAVFSAVSSLTIMASGSGHSSLPYRDCIARIC